MSLKDIGMPSPYEDLKQLQRAYDLKTKQLELAVEALEDSRLILGTANEYNALLTFGSVDLKLKDALTKIKEMEGEK